MNELSKAMAAAFHEIEVAEKGRTNPHFKSKYADLAAVTEAIKPALSKHGLWYRQVMHHLDGGVGVETIIHHASGEFLSCGTLFVPASKHDAQGYGSAITYCRRYSLQAAFGVCPEDDDGNAAAKAKREEPPAVSPVRQKFIRKVADACIAEHAKGNDWGVYENAVEVPSDNVEERNLLWAMLQDHSAVRSTIKRMAQEEAKTRVTA